MAELKVYQLLARAFAAEGVDTLFALMGDAPRSLSKT
jgi:thiamine pyrophosphate-dependent acetolactate synthase large subunit-like protein